MSDNGKWGYASYDVDRYDDYSDSNLGYTRYSGDKVVLLLFYRHHNIITL